jgi:hypothetical protein
MSAKWFCTYTVTDCSCHDPEPHISETWECDSLRDACRNDIPNTVDTVIIEANDSRDSEARWVDFYAISYEDGMEHRHSISIPGNATASSRGRIVRLLQSGKYC